MRMRPLATALAFVLVSAPAAAEAPPDVADLVGARGAGGETQLLSRGYELRHSSKVREQSFTFWWNARTNRCISVSTVDGRYAAILSVPSENCDVASSAPAAPVQSTAPGSGSLVLVCYGAGTRPTVSNDPSYTWDKDKHRWNQTNTLHSGSEGFSSDVQIELYGDHGRIHLGSSLVPPINSGGHDGWWDLQDLRVGPDRITAGYRLNGMNKPKLSVDRRSGQISIDGLSKFSGRCDIGNWGAGERRF